MTEVFLKEYSPIFYTYSTRNKTSKIIIANWSNPKNQKRVGTFLNFTNYETINR
jgi:hypothetical protein